MSHLIPTPHVETTDEPQGPPTRETAVSARGLTLHTRRGAVYGPVDLDVPAGALVVVQGPQGGGRSSLLLTLAGRMVPDRGSVLTVLGEPLPRLALLALAPLSHALDVIVDSWTRSKFPLPIF